MLVLVMLVVLIVLMLFLNCKGVLDNLNSLNEGFVCIFLLVKKEYVNLILINLFNVRYILMKGVGSYFVLFV